ncbi:hypothetical protein J3E68DRAFT_386342 [Trichoderma sp. SZMC 28012]
MSTPTPPKAPLTITRPRLNRVPTFNPIHSIPSSHKPPQNTSAIVPFFPSSLLHCAKSSSPGPFPALSLPLPLPSPFTARRCICAAFASCIFLCLVTNWTTSNSIWCDLGKQATARLLAPFVASPFLSLADKKGTKKISRRSKRRQEPRSLYFF